MTGKVLGALMLTAGLCAFAQEASANAEEMKELWARARALEELLEQVEFTDVQKTPAVEQGPQMRTARMHPNKQANTQGRRLDDPPYTTNVLDTLFLLICGALVMFMQAGFAILEAGSVTSKNSGTVLMKNLMDVCLGSLCWYFLGYGIAYGTRDDDTNTFMGTKNFAAGGFFDGFDAGYDDIPSFLDWFFQWAFCSAAATIVSGGVAERMAFPAYILYSLWMTAFIYPVVVYWTWSGKGWLTIGSGKQPELIDGLATDPEADGYSDFAGSGIVHLVGGIGALTGAILLGPRKDRFVNPDAFKPSNPHLCVLGTLILWFGWYGFNCGSQLAMASEGDGVYASLVAMNSTLAASAGGITVFFLRLAQTCGKEYDMTGMCNGILAGLVAICAGVAVVEPSMAMVTGALGGIFQEIGHLLVLALKIDDPLDAFAVHGMGGICGMLTRPLFDWTGAKESLFGWHLAALAAIWAWTMGWSIVIMLPLKLLKLLRISDAEETTGGDVHLAHSPVKPYETPQ
mmetsp:Transcript_43356/g.80929  ORF Transcript_43356/g.80929 Transcript_43356/m.80929 type:complete len:515 (-) Transcript_43356:349-1893(-)